MVGTPDYVQPLEILYANLVQSFVQRYQSLDIICFATIFSRAHPKDESTTHFPSWVPDWSVTATPLVWPLMVSQSAGRHIGKFRPQHSLKYSARYSASHGTKMNVLFSPDMRELECEGALIDYVEELTRSPRSVDLSRQNISRNSMSMDESSNLQRRNKISSKALDTDGQVSDMAKAVMRCLVLNRGDHYFNDVAPEEEYMKEFATCLAAL